MPVIDRIKDKTHPIQLMIKVTRFKDVDEITWSIKITPGTNAQINPARHILLIGVCAGNT
jgi:hypothetical protein